MKGRLLYIAYQMPPLATSQAKRVQCFVRELAKHGWKVDVLTANSFPGVPDTKIADSVDVFRTFPGVIHKIYHERDLGEPESHDARSGDAAKRASISHPGDLSRIGGFLHGLALPDIKIEWFPSAILEALRLSRRYRYDLILSTAFPHTSHVVAFVLRLFRKLPWVMDSADVWAFSPPVNRLSARFLIQYPMEKEILKGANQVIVFSQGAREEYLANYPFLNPEDVHWVMDPLDLESFRKAPRPEAFDKFTILYAGAIYESQDFEPFLHALSTIDEKGITKDEFDVVFVGGLSKKHRNRIVSFGLESMITVEPFIPFPDLVPLLTGAHALLLFGDGVQVPGKVAPYLTARRPILYIIGGEDDATFDVVGHLNRGICVQNESESISQAIAEMFRLHQMKQLDSAYDLRKLPVMSEEDCGYAVDRICMKAAGIDIHERG